MEFVQGRRERHLCEEEDPYFAHHPAPFTLQRPPPPSSSSSSSSSSARWVPQQMDSTDDHPHQVASSSVAGGAPPEQQQRLAAAFVEKEHMFDKVVTPSDVGKLNRLVIPKQHAEKYFPLDASSNEKGLLLNFEDRTGKQWRFRYSYWNSSQSYVMTKGWSRFVKEKRLDAGDTVSFGRGVGEAGRDRLFIDWKRRPEPLRVPGRFPLPSQAYHFGHHHDLPVPMMSFARSVPPWGRLVTPPASATVPSIAIYDHHRHQLANGHHAPPPASNPFWYLRSAGTASVQFGGGGSGDRAVPVVLDSVPLVPSNAAAAAKRVRLFGVNLDCSAPEEAADAIAQRGYPRPPPLPPLQLRLGVSDMVESPRKDKQPMSLDLGM